MEPDGDAAGSTVAMAIAMPRLGKGAVMISSEGDPEAFVYLGKHDWRERSPSDIDARVVIALDSATPSRLAWDGDFERAPVVVKIDHQPPTRATPM